MPDQPAADRPALSRRFLEELIFAFDGSRRFTQDSPVLPDVWLYYGCEDPLGALDLLLSPHWGTRAGALAARLRKERLLAYRRDHPALLWAGGERVPARIAYTHATVAARLYFDELVRVVLPMTEWWSEILEAAKAGREAKAAPGTKGAGAKKGARAGAAKKAARPRKSARDAKPIAALREDLGDETVRPVFVRALGEVIGLARARAAGRRVEPPPRGLTPPGVRAELFWMAGVIGVIAWTARHAAGLARGGGREGAAEARAGAAVREEEGCEAHLDAAEVVAALDELLAGAREYPSESGDGRTGAAPAGGLERVYFVNRNRPAGMAVVESGPAIKADAARRLFDVKCGELTWAVIDSGIDATHPAFHLRDAAHAPLPPEEERAGGFPFGTRVLKTYDFTRLRDLLDPAALDPAAGALPEHVKDAIAEGEKEGSAPAARARAQRAQADLATLRELLDEGRDLDWSLFEPLLEVPHDRYYEVPPAAFDHGTHVAGILAADWWRDGEGGWSVEMQGICPDLRLYDLRVLGPPVAGGAGAGGDGEFAARGGEEFVVIAALQFVRHLNSTQDFVVVHGANLSLSINHDIANFACGRTPVCEECERLVESGVVVVAAAGNQGYLRYQTNQGFKEGYHTVSITDPGNAEAVITVGATHRNRPHEYGVSYFSSRGPTGDGRAKPDLVAPGEKVTAPLPGGVSGRKDGTSMAAPHVSGAAALLMARYDELVGRPRRVKELICSTATDLGRERYFQGAGMLDVLRAMQAQ